ncbi:MAG: DinB family protein [Henriciella sp.]
MTTDLKSVLLRQHEMTWKLCAYHLTDLSTEDCLWRPGNGTGPHVWRHEDGQWRGEWPKTETYELGPASIGWLTGHMVWWWSRVIDKSFGDGTLDADEIVWPGSGEAVVATIEGLQRSWVSHVTALDEAALCSFELTRWPFTKRPFADVVAWVNTELTKNAAEIGYVRFLRQQ